MDKGTTTISSAEYRELIENATSYRMMFNDALAENNKLLADISDYRTQAEVLHKELEEVNCMRDYYRNEIKSLKNRLRKYEETEVSNDG